ncbi:hypothetical protein [Sphingobium sp. SA2]|uniref:hypothetical protein n=1 Tax=Sphingobium sp. SA2 TaxID=1524832 RepID=UPI00391DA677
MGAKVAIIEHATIGGTCVNIGCVPSKTLIRAAEHCFHSAYPNFEGLAACPPPSDWQRVIEQKNELVAALRENTSMWQAPIPTSRSSGDAPS